MIEQWYYLIALTVAIICLGCIDYKYKLAFWYAKKRTLLTISITIATFIIWDLAGISLGIFFHGGSIYTLPFRILPEFPIEELFFLFLLSYVTLLLYLGVAKWQRT